MVARVGGAKRKWANLSVWASEFDAFNTGTSPRVDVGGARTLARRSAYAVGWRFVNGTCGGHFFKLGATGNKTCEELVTRVGYSSATIEDKKGWTTRVTGDHAEGEEYKSNAVRAARLTRVTTATSGNHVYDRLSGPRHRLDVSISAADGAAARSLPHGIVTHQQLFSDASGAEKARLELSSRHRRAELLLRLAAPRSHRHLP